MNKALLQFWIECESRSISPWIALENEAVASAVRDGDETAIIKALNENF